MSMQVSSLRTTIRSTSFTRRADTPTRKTVSVTRYVFFGVRTLANPEDPADLKAAHALQDASTVEQARAGSFEAPAWDTVSQNKVRAALETLNSLGSPVPSSARRAKSTPSGISPAPRPDGAAIPSKRRSARACSLKRTTERPSIDSRSRMSRSMGSGRSALQREGLLREQPQATHAAA